ncbi:MAG: hypothetical protein EBT57_04130 [Verrucomicrobia bacterium]|nr:hypothetical protein [Verrucomicrobiota bacterium]
MNWNPGDEIARAPRTLRKGLLYFYRSLRLRCPTCGVRPIFSPVRKVRSLREWFTPLDGCPQCGYPYEREEGYFLMAIWGVNYGLIGLGAMSLYFILRINTNWNPLWLFCGTVIPAPFACIFFARHAKSMFLALDHFFDPHLRTQKTEKNSE